MRIRSRRKRKEFLLKIRIPSKKNLIRIGIITAAIILLFAFGISYINIRNMNFSYLAKREIIDVGIRTDVPGFCTYNEGGELEGFDKDIIDEILKRILPEEKPINYISLYTEDSCSSMKYGITDIGIGFLVDGSDRTEGWTNTNSYYYDDIYAVVSPDGNIIGVEDFEGKSIGILNSMISVSEAERFLEKEKIDAEVLRYYDYETANMDISSGKIAALLTPKGLMTQYFPQQSKISEPLFKVGYCIVLPTGQNAVEAAINSAVAEMKKDGTIERLAQKWKLPYTS